MRAASPTSPSTTKLRINVVGERRRAQRLGDLRSRLRADGGHNNRDNHNKYLRPTTSLPYRAPASCELDGYISPITTSSKTRTTLIRDFRNALEGETYEATIVGIEESNDVAVLKINATGLSR
jgi:hypothetical protein